MNNSPTYVPVDGVYPVPPAWKRIRRLTLIEAQNLTDLHGITPVDGYLWINKGYILLPPGIQRDPNKEPVEGTQAVYLTDGKYLLIERTHR